ncbi:MAG TPA: (2Fe-2S)-binding protein [Actinomycetota bacterium]
MRLTVNGSLAEASVEPRDTLADLLRERLGLTGTKVGCEHGVCGACTVLLDGSSVRSCLVLALQADGRVVDTVEGLAGDEQLHPIQRAFNVAHAVQCGFCTPGMLMVVAELLAEEAAPDERRIRERVGGNLCRCTGYENIVRAVQLAVGDTPTRGGDAGRA